jgi:hypothetical protein
MNSTSSTAAVIDSQFGVALCAAARGYGDSKKVSGRKRNIAVDADGRLLMVNLTPAVMADSTGVEWVLTALKKR